MNTILQKPWVRALIAAAYIVLFAFSIRYTGNHFDQELDPAVGITLFLSMFVFSAALMAYLFFFEPLRLLVVEKMPREALAQFGITFGCFLAFALGAVAALFFALG